MQSEDDNDALSKANQFAKSLSERTAALVERDKLLRSRREKQTDIRTATAVLGTCPDMCPEFERYFREDTNQLSVFEMMDNKQGDPHAMVKEYRRAGADQEEPLPHELRPPPVLMRTMDYLMCNIMDRTDQSVGDWYDFVWSRLRAIRKDITQQHLCDLTSVCLLEKCTRFHILCGHYLCEEDLTAFDPKINNENLTKCLQSLKDFYYDLSLKGVLCPNEVEFRCYDVLLNVGGTDVSREIKQLRKEVRNSKPIKFALEVHFAFSSNNFVKFFKLVSETTYLNACILHRYFNSIRFDALKIVQKAYRTKVFDLNYPAIDQLGFNDVEELDSFCKALGLTAKDETLVLHKGTVIDNPSGLPSVRSYRLIEEKRRNRLLGEIVNGSPLPSNPYKQFPLQNSFDALNRLKKEALNAEDQSAKTQQLISTTHTERGVTRDETDFLGKSLPQQNDVHINVMMKMPVTKVQPEFTEKMVNTAVAHQAEKLCNSVVDSCLYSILFDLLFEAKSMLMFNEFFSLTLMDVVSQICDRVYSEEKKNVQLKLQVEAASGLVANEFADYVIDCETTRALRFVANEVFTNEFRKYVQRESDIISAQLLKETAESLVKSIGKRCLQEQKEETEMLVSMIKTRRYERLAKECIALWRRKCVFAKQYRFVRNCFPASVNEGKPIAISTVDLKYKREHSTAFNGESISNLSPKKSKQIDVKPCLAPKLFADHVRNLTKTYSIYAPRNSIELKLQELQCKIEEEKQQTQLMGETCQVLKESFDFLKACKDET